MAEDNQQPAATEEQAQHPVFNIEKVYVRDMSVEVPTGAQAFLQRETPQIGIELQHRAGQLDDGIFEAVVTVTVTAKIEDKVQYLVEVAQAGIFQVRNFPDEAMESLLGIACPNILFPYAREAISDMVSRAGFMPVLLSPVNFEALFVQQKQHHMAQQQAAADAGTQH